MNIKLIIKGFIIGLGKILPGISGSMLAITLGIYEKLINIITNFTSNIKENIIFLLNFIIGVIIALVLFSKILLYLLNNYYSYTMYLFIGLIIGTIISFSKEIKISKKNIIIFIIVLSLMLFLSNINCSIKFIYEKTIINNIYIIILGFIDATTMIIPGISGTAIFMLLGVYEFVLTLFSNPISFLFILYGIGMFSGIIIISYLMKYLLDNYKDETYSIIMALSIASILILISNVISLINIKTIILLLIGLIIGTLFDK